MQSVRISLSHSRGPLHKPYGLGQWDTSGSDEPVAKPLAIRLDPPDRRVREMHRHHEGAGAGDLAEEFSPRARSLLLVPVEDRRPVRLPALQRMVHEVADDDRALAAGADVDAAVAGRVARRG